MGILNGILKAGIPLALTAGAYLAARMSEKYRPMKEQPRSDLPIMAALGDEMTFGSGVLKSRATDCWEAKLERMLAGSWQVLNYGMPGAALQNESDFPYWDPPRADWKGFPQAAAALHPGILLLMLGSNDARPYNWNAERFSVQLTQRVQELQASGARVILMTPPSVFPAGEAQGTDISAGILADETVPAILACAETLGVECIDLHAATAGHPEYFCDGVLPNSLGNHVIAKTICSRISGV